MTSSALATRRDQRTRNSTNTRATFAPFLLLLVATALLVAASALSVQAQVSSLISATGLTEGQATRNGQQYTANVQLTAPLVVEGEDLVIAVLNSEGQQTQITVPIGSSTGNGQALIAGVDGGWCTWTYSSGDARFAGWTQTITFAGRTFVASGVPAGGRVQVGTTRTLSLTVGPVRTGGWIIVDVACKSGGSAVGMLGAGFIEFAEGVTTQSVQYTLPGSAVDITCDFTARNEGDSALALKTTALSFSTATAPTLSVSGIESGTVLVTGSQHALTLTASPAVANGAITVTSTCALSPATFVLGDGATTATVTYTAPDTPRDAVSCNFNLAPGGDPYYAAITSVGAMAFAIDVPLVIAVDAAPVLATGRTQPISLSFSRAVATDGLQMTATCSAGSIPSPFTVSATATTHVVQYTADGAEAEGVSCAFERLSGDDRYAAMTVGLTRDVVVVGLDVSGPTAGVELLGSSTTEFTITASHQVFGSALVVVASCSDGTGAVGSFEPAQLSIAAGSTSAALVYTAPAASVASLVCSFSYVSGDERFADLSPSMTFSVLQPVLTFSGVTNGAALLTGSQSNLTVAANVPIDGQLSLIVQCFAIVPPGSFNIIVLNTILIIAAGETSSFVTLTALLQPLSAGVKCNIYPMSGDARFNRAVVTDAVPTIVFTTVLPTVTLNGLTEGAQVQAGSTQQITLTVSDAIVGVDDLSVNVTCPGTAVSGYFRVHTDTTLSTTTRVVVPVNATVGTTFTCTFKYLRGDIRYTHAAMPTPVSFSVAPVPVIEPSSSSSTGGGDSASSTAAGPDDGSSAGDASGGSTADAVSGSSSTAGTTGGTGGDDPSGLFSSSTATVSPCTDDSECGATGQAASGFASLALAMAIAAALRC